jgi:hypothetical protein
MKERMGRGETGLVTKIRDVVVVDGRREKISSFTRESRWAKG